jgi:Mg/Co/Ni transporter MgtE
VKATDIDATLERIRAALETNDVEEGIAALIRFRPADRAKAFADLPDEDPAARMPRLDVPTIADMLEELEDPEAADAVRLLPPGRRVDATGLAIYISIAAAVLTQI